MIPVLVRATALRVPRWMRWAAGSALGLIAGVGMALVIDWDGAELDASARSRLPGQFVALSDGYTNYEIAGPSNGPVVLLVPGISVPRAVFARTIGPLADAGYRVVAFDLFGRGFSDRPRVRYDPALFNRQIDELLDTLRIERPVTLVGLVTGGLVSVLYAEHRPSRVNGLVLIEPEGLEPDDSLFGRFLRWPIVGEATGRLLMNLVGERRWEERLGRYTEDRRLVADVIGFFRAQIAYKGFRRALISTAVHMPLSDAGHAYRRVAERSLPTLIVWGARDEITPLRMSRNVRAALPAAVYLEVQAGHLPHYERPDVVNDAIRRFLDERIRSASAAGRVSSR